MFRDPPGGLPLSNPWMLLATWGGVGLVRYAPGTVGSLVAVPFAMALLYWGGPWLLAAATVAVALSGTRAASIIEQQSGESDPGPVVVDEVAGQWLAYAVIAFTITPPGPIAWLAGFAAFRFFDIVKPWPCGWIDRRVKGGAGIMADDLVAGGYAAILVVAGLALSSGITG